MINVDKQVLQETFFYNQVHKDYKVNSGNQNTDFLVAGCYDFNIGEKTNGKYSPDVYYAIDGIEKGEKNKIPLWLFGFLY